MRVCLSSDLEGISCFMFEMKEGKRFKNQNFRRERTEIEIRNVSESRKFIIIVCVTRRGSSEDPLCILKAASWDC